MSASFKVRNQRDATQSSTSLGGGEGTLRQPWSNQWAGAAYIWGGCFHLNLQPNQSATDVPTGQTIILSVLKTPPRCIKLKITSSTTHADRKKYGGYLDMILEIGLLIAFLKLWSRSAPAFPPSVVLC